MTKQLSILKIFLISIFVLPLLGIFLVVFLLLLYLIESNLEGGFLIFTLGIAGFYLVKVLFFYVFIVGIIPSLFLGWGFRQMFHFLSPRYILWWGVPLILIILFFFPRSSSTLLKIPIPENARDARYYSARGAIDGYTPPLLKFKWEVSDKEFRDFYITFFKRKAYKLNGLSNDYLYMECQLDNPSERRPSTVFIIKSETAVRVDASDLSLPCFWNLMF